MTRSLIDIAKLDVLLQGEIRKISMPRHDAAGAYRLVVWRHAPGPDGCNWSAAVKGTDEASLERIDSQIARIRSEFNVG